MFAGGSGGSAGTTTTVNGVTVGLAWQGLDPALFDRAMVQSREFKKWWPQFYKRAYPLGYVADGADDNAWLQVKDLDWAQQAIGIAVPQWISIGPAPIFEPGTGIRSSGQASAIAVRPGRKGEWLVGSSYGGIWKTTDGGMAWRNVTDYLHEPGAEVISALAYASGYIVYAGTGHGGSDVPSGIGLLKSTDAGEHWH
jgi:hypothetical protein